MSLHFRRPRGAAADVKELEYIVALCQTNVRESATLGSLDVQRHLKSRYGLSISHEQAIEVVQGVCGGDAVVGEEDDDDLPERYFDLVQLLSVLLIPAIARKRRDVLEGVPEKPLFDEPEYLQWAKGAFGWFWKLPFWSLVNVGWHYEKAWTEPVNGLLSDARRLLLAEVGGDRLLDETLVRDLLLQHGEVERAQNDELIREMVLVAGATTGLLDDEALLRAVSADLVDWDVDGETRLSSFLFDVFGQNDVEKIEQLEADSSEPDVEDPVTDVDGKATAKPPFDPEWGNIDGVVDSHMSVSIVVATWAFFIASYVK